MVGFRVRYLARLPASRPANALVQPAPVGRSADPPPALRVPSRQPGQSGKRVRVSPRLMFSNYCDKTPGLNGDMSEFSRSYPQMLTGISQYILSAAGISSRCWAISAAAAAAAETCVRFAGKHFYRPRQKKLVWHSFDIFLQLRVFVFSC